MTFLNTPVNDLIDFTGSIFEGIETNTVILSNFQSTNSFNGFNIVEIELDENISAVPVPAAIWLFASSLIGMISLRRNNS